MKQIFMTVPLHGLSKGESKIEITTEGFKGTACADATRAIEAILGRVREDTPTAEMFDTEEQHERLNNGE